MEQQKLTRIRVSHEVARTRTAMGGVHNVVLGTGAEQRIVQFSSRPTYVRGELPAEIAENRFLLKESVTESDMKGQPGEILNLPQSTATVASDGNPVIPAELAALRYHDLLKLAGDLGIDTGGKKGELAARIQAHRDRVPPGGTPPTTAS